MLNYRSNVNKLKCPANPCPYCSGTRHGYCPRLLQVVGARGWIDIVRFGLWLNCRKSYQIVPLPGDALRTFIFYATAGKAKHGTDCEVERVRLNGLGWLGCWRDRKAIWERLQRKAAEESWRLDRRTAIGYVGMAARHAALRFLQPLKNEHYPAGS